MSEGRIVGGCCGNFPEPEVDKEKKEEKGCCNSDDCGCGLGPVKEGSVQDAAGASVLLQKKPRFGLISTPHLISTPAGGKYIISGRVFEGIMFGTTVKLVGIPALQIIFAKKIGETKERFHYLPVAASDISPYFESALDTESVGRATIKEKSSRSSCHTDLDSGGLFD